MTKLPYLPLYTGDWLKDPDLSMCSPSTRGIWIDMLCAMHEKERSGEISGYFEGMSRLCRCSTEELKTALDELKNTNTADVIIFNNHVTIKNRRMKRELKFRELTRIRVQKYRDKKHDFNKDVTDKKQPVTENEIEIDIDNDINIDRKGGMGEKQKVPCDKIVSLYHNMLPTLTNVTKLTDQRKSAINQRWNEYPDIETFKIIFEKVAKSNFLIGLTKDWKADFDFIMTKSKFVKILEGSYDNIQKPKPPKDREKIPKSFQGWKIDKKTVEKEVDNLGHNLDLYCRAKEFDEPLKIWYCPECDKQFNYREK